MLISFDKEDSVKISVHGFNENEMKLLENKYDKLRSPDKMDWFTVKLINNIEVTFFRTIWEEKKNG
jgi:hypothetical protein